MRLHSSLVAVATGSLLLAACAGMKLSPQSSADREPATIDTWRDASAQTLSSGDLSDLSSSGSMSLKSARLITDNFSAFQSKLNIIRGAKREIRMVYYIYSDDLSSSQFNTEVLAAAQRGVKVYLLVDFLTNYERMDLFTYLEKAGQGNIKVSFYGLPTAAILKGAVFQTLPCGKGAVNSPEQCQNEKTELMQKMGNPEATWFSKLYLTGLYGKNPALLQTAIGLGGQFDPKSLKEGAQPTAEEKAKLKEFAKLVIAAKMKNDLVAKAKVSVALQTYGSTLNPIMNELTGRLPLGLGGGPDWEHITDYTHHKLIVADGEKFQLGGRNIEDSYHSDSLSSKIPEAKVKYTFMDTDFYAESSGAKAVEAAYDRLFRFDAMVSDLARVQSLAPNEYDVNSEQFKVGLGACLQEGKATPQDLETCVGAKMKTAAGYQTLEARMEKVSQKMAANSQTFASKYQATTRNDWRDRGDSLDSSDLESAKAFYLENLSFSKSKPKQRFFGARIGLESETGKSIHSAWFKGLENTCAVSSKNKQKTRVVLHSAYLFMPSGLINALGNMMNGKWNCSYVDVVILTNSFQTTDLNIINIFARYQLQALFVYNQFIEKNKEFVTPNQYKARFRYFEYAPLQGQSGVSLHSKVSVLGNDMIVGSANADVRSYYMDTNNALWIRNAQGMVADYNAYIDRIIADKKVVEFTKYYSNVMDEQLVAENKAILRALLEKWDGKGRVTPQKQAQILGYVDQLGAKIRSTTHAIVSAPQALDEVSNVPGRRLEMEKMKELDQLANGFDSLWKVL